MVQSADIQSILINREIRSTLARDYHLFIGAAQLTNISFSHTVSIAAKRTNITTIIAGFKRNTMGLILSVVRKNLVMMCQMTRWSKIHNGKANGGVHLKAIALNNWNNPSAMMIP